MRLRRPCASSFAPEAMGERSTLVLTAYLRLWSVANILRILSGFVAGTALKDTVQAQPVHLLLGLLVGTLLRPVPPLALGALAVRVATNLSKGPWMGNSQLWATFTDVALLIALCRACARRRSAGALDVSEERAVVESVAATIRAQLFLFYLASGFWKVNSSFLHADYSCGSLFTVQPLEYLPDDVLFGSALVKRVARLIADTGPGVTLALEFAMPALHLPDAERWPRAARAGVLATLFFHLAIGFTPPPSNVSSYGVTTVTRLFFCLPEDFAAAVDDVLRRPLLRFALAAAPAAALAVVEPLHAVAVSTVQGSGRDWHLAYYAALCVVVGRACLAPPAAKPAQKTEATDRPHGRACRAQVALAFFYAFLMPIIGLQEKGGCLMFSQLRLHGGSNHLLLPTSLLQRWYYGAEPSNAFAGGVVRINAYSLDWIGSPFAEHMSPRTLRVIRDVAAVPGEYVWAAKQVTARRDVPPPRKWRYTVSNLGLRRLLMTAKRQGEPLRLEYERLPGPAGDERWRTQAPGDAVLLDVDGRGNVTSCLKAGEPCDDDELALVAPPDATSAAFATMLLPQPNPIIPGMTAEMHCVTWG